MELWDCVQKHRDSPRVLLDSRGRRTEHQPFQQSPPCPDKLEFVGDSIVDGAVVDGSRFLGTTPAPGRTEDVLSWSSDLRSRQGSLSCLVSSLEPGLSSPGDSTRSKWTFHCLNE